MGILFVYKEDPFFELLVLSHFLISGLIDRTSCVLGSYIVGGKKKNILWVFFMLGSQSASQIYFTLFWKPLHNP